MKMFLFSIRTLVELHSVLFEISKTITIELGFITSLHNSLGKRDFEAVLQHRDESVRVELFGVIALEHFSQLRL